MEFSRQEFWSGLSFPSPGELPNPGIESGSPALQADSLPAELSGKPIKEIVFVKESKNLSRWQKELFPWVGFQGRVWQRDQWRNIPDFPEPLLSMLPFYFKLV